MEWDIPIYEQEVLRGQLRVERQGLRTVFRADCPAWDDTIKKVWLRGNGGNLLLGTLVPEGDRLKLNRTISNAMLREKGLEHCQRSKLKGPWDNGHSESPPSGCGKPVDASGAAFPAGDGSNAGRGHPEHEKRRLAAGSLVGFASAVPGRLDSGCPCMPIFCFASYSTRRGGMLTWFLDERGNPLIKQV